MSACGGSGEHNKSKKPANNDELLEARSKWHCGSSPAIWDEQAILLFMKRYLTTGVNPAPELPSGLPSASGQTPMCSDHLKRQIVFLPIGGDLSIEIVTGGAVMTSKPDEHSRPADPFVLVRRRTLRGRLPSGT